MTRRPGPRGRLRAAWNWLTTTPSIDHERGQVDLGGLGWAFMVFVGLIILGAIIENLVLGQAVDPVLGYAENMSHSSERSREGLRVLEQWRNLFTLIVIVTATMFFIGYAVFVSNRRR